MEYIKKPKIWKKRFEKETLSQIWAVFKNVAPVGVFNMSFLDAHRDLGNFPHPETDETDNSMGVQPKQIEKFLVKFSIEDLEKVLWVLHIGLTPSVDSDGFVNWEDVWNGYVKNNLNSDNIVRAVIGSVLIIPSDQILDKLELNPYLLPYAMKLKKANNLTSVLLLNSIEDELQEKWKHFKMNPKSKALASSNPENFDREVLDCAVKVNQGEKLIDLSFAKQYYAVTMAEMFGEILLSMTLEKLNIHGLKAMIGDPQLPAVKEKEVLELFQEMSLQQIGRSAKAYGLIDPKKLKELLIGEDKGISSSIITSLINLKLSLIESNSTHLIEFLDGISSRHLKYYMRYEGGLSEQSLKRLFEIYQSRSKDMNIPLLVGSVGSYSYELIDKTVSTEGLVLGYATDCCQVAFGVAKSCLEAGYSSPNASFFVVRKNKNGVDTGKIYGQSYLFSGVDKNGMKYIVFDSIEVLGKDLNNMSGVMDSYIEAGNKLIDLGYDYILCGADGSHMPDGLEDSTFGYYSANKCYYNEVSVDKALGFETYTDMKIGAFLIAGNSLMEFDNFDDYRENDEDDYDDEYDEDEDYDENED